MFKLLHAIWARLDLTNVGLLAIAVLWFALVSLCLWFGKTDSRKRSRAT